MRHAKSDWSLEGQDDFERGLNKRGLRDAPFMGSLLKEKKLIPQLLIASPARRTRLTAEMVAENLGYTAEILYFDELYESSGKQYLSVLQTMNNRVDRAMIVGHNPSLEELIDILLQMNLPHVEMPTSAVAVLDLHVNSWAELGEKCATLQDYHKPKDHF